MLIGICGKAGSGKDTVADQIVRHGNFVKYSLADPIKQMLRVIDINCNSRVTKEIPDRRFGVSPRRMAQTLGTEWGRDLIHKDIWLILAKERWMKLKGLGVNMVVPDIRFPNEVNWIRKEGYLFHVYRDVESVEEHSSEQYIPTDENDFLIYNYKTIYDLYRTVNNTMGVLFGSK